MSDHGALPKALVDINGEPFIAHQLRLLHANGIRRVVLCLGYLGEWCAHFVGDGSAFGLEVEYSFDGPVLRGTAGAIHQALPLLGSAFFVLYGDSYLPCDYAAVEEAFRQSGKPGLMTVFRNEGQWDSSNVEFAAGRILAYDKKNRTPRMRYIDYGLGVFDRRTFEALAPGSLTIWPPRTRICWLRMNWPPARFRNGSTRSALPPASRSFRNY